MILSGPHPEGRGFLGFRTPDHDILPCGTGLPDEIPPVGHRRLLRQADGET